MVTPLPLCRIYASANSVSIASDNDLPPDQRQAIIWTNARILLIGPLGTNSVEFKSKHKIFHSWSCFWKCLLPKWRPSHLCLNVLSIPADVIIVRVLDLINYIAILYDRHVTCWLYMMASYMRASYKATIEQHVVSNKHIKSPASILLTHHDDVIKWKHFPRNWPFAQGIHRSPVNSPHKGQWRGALMFSLIWVWMNGWVNNPEAGGLRCNRAHCDITVMCTSGSILFKWLLSVDQNLPFFMILVWQNSYWVSFLDVH